MLNHVEKRLSDKDLMMSMERAKEVGLLTMVCADDQAGAVRLAKSSPTIIIVESPEKIGGSTRNLEEVGAIKNINAAVRHVNSQTLVLHGAGINGPEDVFDVIAAGADGTGSTSGVMKAKDPFAMLETMIEAVQKAWMERKLIEEVPA